jgi:hypothetical protein
MNTSLRTRSIVAMLAISAIAPVAPAAASSDVGSVTSIAPPIDRPDPNYSSLNATVPPSNDSTAGGERSGALVLRKVGPVPLVTTVDRGAADGSEYRSVNALAPPADEPSAPEPGYASANAITGPPSGEPTIVAGSPGNDGFDWGDAGLGAAAAMTTLLALGAAGLLASRRRTGISPSASTS